MTKLSPNIPAPISSHDPPSRYETSSPAIVAPPVKVPPVSNPQDHADRNLPPLLVVGIGASAGGLEAFSELFSHVPYDHMAFIVMQHLSPEHRSILPMLLQRVSEIRVVEARNGQTIQTNHVYVATPNTDIAVSEGKLCVWERAEKRGHKHPIDFFLRSLAEDCGATAIGVVLSGTGNDGTQGLKAIQAAGGITFAQDTHSAKFNNMPDSAVRAGHVDFCLAPGAIAEEIARLAKSRLELRQASAAVDGKDWLRSLLIMIRTTCHLDFSSYKLNTLKRRIERRMGLKKMRSYNDYLDFAKDNPEELHALAGDMLINVTRFFRDATKFVRLNQQILSTLIHEGNATQPPLRLWLTACASGEEAYSITICIAEAIAAKGSNQKVQIFATDISAKAIEFARKGIYPLAIADDVNAARLARFFIKKEESYHVRREIRDLIVFSRHDLLRDPPLSRIDFISCRNVLIYMRPPAQRQIFNRLHYALNTDRFLFLGSSESVAEAQDLFYLYDKEAKVYRRKEVITRSTISVPHASSPRDPQIDFSQFTQTKRLTLKNAVDCCLVKLCGVKAVVIDEQCKVLQLRGQTSPYVTLSSGEVNLDLYSLSPIALHHEMRRTIALARTTHEEVAGEVHGYLNGTARTVHLRVTELRNVDLEQRCVVIAFSESQEEAMPSVNHTLKTVRSSGKSEKQVRRVRQDLGLRKIQACLEAALEEKNAANRELFRASEVSKAAIEELQSMNEELETSKEELQSTNQELIVLNEEVRNRMEEIADYHEDLNNLLIGIDLPVLLISKDKKLRRFSTKAADLFNLTTRDLNKDLSYLELLFDGINLEEKIDEVHKTRQPLSRQISFRKKLFCLIQIQPVIRSGDNFSGTFIRLQPIHAHLHFEFAEKDSIEIIQFAEKNWSCTPRGVIVFDANKRIVWANRALEKIFGTPRESLSGRFFEQTFLATALGDKVTEALHQPPQHFENGKKIQAIVSHKKEHSKLTELEVSQIYLSSGVALHLLFVQEL